MEEGKGGSRGIGWLEVRNTLVQLQERGRKERCGAEKGQKRRVYEREEAALVGGGCCSLAVYSANISKEEGSRGERNDKSSGILPYLVRVRSGTG